MRASRRAAAPMAAILVSTGLVALPAAPAAAAPGVITSIPVSLAPISSTISPDGRHAYVASLVGKSGGNVSVIDTTTNTVTTTVPVGNTPTDTAVSPDGKRVYVANNGSNTVTPINTQTNQPLSPIAVVAEPVDLAASEDGRFVYVASGTTNDMSVIDTGTGSASTVTAGYSQAGIALTPDGSRAYIARNNNSVAVLNTSTGLVNKAIPLSGDPLGVAMSPDGTRAYVAQSTANSVAVIDTSTDELIGTVTVGEFPLRLTVSPDNSEVYVANYVGGTVSVIDTANNAVTSTVTTGPYMSAVAVMPDRSRLYATRTSELKGPRANGQDTVQVIAVSPSPPTAVTAAAADKQVTASWSAPDFTGGQAITSYTATASPGGKSCTSSTTSCTIAGLENGKAQTVEVTATNSFGTSLASAPSNSVTPALPPAPSKPKAVTAKVSSTKVTTSWQSVPGAASYTVRITGKNRKNKKTSKAKSTTATKSTVAIKLKASSKAKICVTATNAGGTGPSACVKRKVKK